MGWVAAVDFKRGGDRYAVQPRRNFGKLEKLHNGVVIGAVADGGEGAARGHVGARTSVQAGLSVLGAEAEQLSTMLIGNARPTLEALFAKVTETVGEAVARVAAEERCASADYAASLTVFFAGPFGLAAMQVGRSLLVYRPRGGDYGLVFEVADRPDGAEYLTGADAVDKMRIGFTRGQIEFLCLASRAFEPALLEEDDRLPSVPFFRPLDHYASGALDDGDVHRGIRAFLRTSDASRNLEEDLTLALCRYNPSSRMALGLR